MNVCGLWTQTLHKQFRVILWTVRNNHATPKWRPQTFIIGSKSSFGRLRTTGFYVYYGELKIAGLNNLRKQTRSPSEGLLWRRLQNYRAKRGRFAQMGYKIIERSEDISLNHLYMFCSKSQKHFNTIMKRKY